MIYFRNLYFCLFLMTTGCATYQGKVEEARHSLSIRHYDEALEKLKPMAEKTDGDQLVYLLDYGVALHMAGKFKDSNKVFQQAEQLSEQLDYHSVSRLAGATLFNEEMVQYKGDSFEKIFINAYMAMNYLSLNMFEDAMVEARRINEKIIKLNSDGKANYEKNSFGKYLSALLWEADKKWDDAYIAYNEAYEIDPTIPTIGQDLIRSAFRARRMEEYKKWKEIFPEVIEDKHWYDKTYGEIIVLVQQGWGPRKRPNPVSPIMPTLEPVHSETQKVSVTIGDSLGGTSSGTTDGKSLFDSIVVYDVTRDAIKTLQADATSLAARRIGSRVAKEVMADQIRQKNEALGLVAWIAMVASERADLRQWSTLPQTIQMVRFNARPGRYKLSIQGKSGYGTASEDIVEREVSVDSNKKSFLIYRTTY